MSRTYKDNPVKSTWDDTHEAIPYTYEAISIYGGTITVTRHWYKDIAGAKPKLRKRVDTEDHWMTTPGWWVRLTMNKPQRRAVHLWERKALFSDLEDLVQPAKKVAHIYYW